MSQDRGRAYWENAGAQGYEAAMYSSQSVALHVNQRLWGLCMHCAQSLGTPIGAKILELGCGDGTFAKQVLAAKFSSVDALDVSEAAIARARTGAPKHLRFSAADITHLDLASLGDGKWDCAFLFGFLHHVKPETPEIVRRLSDVVPRVVVMEPNGNHLARKLLELLPSYRKAGEDSFRRTALRKIFENSGYELRFYQRINLFPNFTPTWVFRVARRLEPLVERSKWLDMLCTDQVMGFEKAR